MPLLTLTPPYKSPQGFLLPVIVNVAQRVGPGEANQMSDIKIVQRLLQMGAKGFGGTAAIVGLPTPTGKFDAVTGFWIYNFQAIQKRNLFGDTIIDGIVSSAHGAMYAAHGRYTIVQMNLIAKVNSPTEYAAFVGSGGVA